MDMSKLPRMGGTAKGEEPIAPPPVRATVQHENTFCKQCGLPVQKYDRFCGNCGAALVAIAPPPVEPEVKEETRPLDYAGRTPNADDLRGEVAFRLIEVWVMLFFVAVLLALGGWKYARYLAANARGQTFDSGVIWTSGPNEGKPVPYDQVQGHPMLSDSSFFYGSVSLLVAMIAGVLVALLGRRWPGAMRMVAYISAGVAAGVMVFNLYRTGQIFHDSAIPLFTMLLVGMGGFLIFDQITLTRLCIGDQSIQTGAKR